MAAKKKSSPAFDFVVNMVKKNPQAAYADVKAAADRKGYKIFPIVYGRAKALLGQVSVAPHGSKKRLAAKKAAARRAAAKSPVSAMSSLEAVIGVMKEGERDRERYRQALEEISEIIDRVT